MKRRNFLAKAAAPLLVPLFAERVWASGGKTDTGHAEADAMELEDAIRKRKMIRKYKKDAVPDEVVTKLLSIAHRAPSAGFSQVQEFIVVRDAAQKERLAKAALNQMFIAEAPVVVVVASNWKRAVKRYGDRAVNFYSITDGAYATMLILLACVKYALGTCSVGAFDDAEVTRILKLPNYVRPIFINPIGYPAESPAPLNRLPLEQIVHREVWREK